MILLTLLLVQWQPTPTPWQRFPTPGSPQWQAEQRELLRESDREEQLQLERHRNDLLERGLNAPGKENNDGNGRD